MRKLWDETGRSALVQREVASGAYIRWGFRVDRRADNMSGLRQWMR